MSKVLVLSEDLEFSTTIVLRWINYLGYEFIRINKEDEIKIKEISVTGNNAKFQLIINDNNIVNSDSIMSYWFRRGKLNFINNENLSLLINESKFNKQFEKLIAKLPVEYRRIENFIYDILENLRSIGSSQKSNNNKLIHINIARSLGIKVPDTYIVSTKDEVIELFNKYPNGLITKPISDVASLDFVDENLFEVYQTYTNKLSLEDINALPEFFFPSLFQEYINKEIEIRSFYLNGEFYSMAIFSQKDDKTAIDFRRYNFERPNKTTLFNLPHHICSILDEFMKKIGLNSGSIDLIYSSNKEFTFLEVNPVGQFGMVSQPCNYFLEKKIATYLISN